MTDTDIKDNNTRANKSLTDEDKEALKHFVMWESTIMPELPKKPTKYSFIKEKLMDNSNIFHKKPSPFKEKMTSIKIVQPDSGQLLGTVTNFDLFPGSTGLVAFLDFFNLVPDKTYVLSVDAYFQNGTHYPVHATRINIPKSEFIDLKDDYGKATGHFEFNFTIQLPSDFYFYFNLSDEEGNQLDEAYSYHSFIKQG
ncbi:hypothetical protein D8852_05175 [Streptococcus mitis]|jgi:hypothetical protein|uniref:Uncharacterized protein n=1 Tax=Streptococcus mitis TaxID=28037 RepID=A0A3R9R8S5_STRMT|nr:hypothetical protein [Streptococcus mitis]RSI80751.1 hypothetical protein D8852_05175 [Streptococcus mitis]RSJ06760.1 hypothetical protein D8839_08110 [Streptococcus mitis]